MKKPKTFTEYRLIETHPFGRIKTYPEKTLEVAIKDRDKYENDRLGRTAVVEQRTMTIGPWEPVE